MELFTQRQQNDINLLRRFISLYCGKQHADLRQSLPERNIASLASSLCPDCTALLEYAVERLRRCPLEPKPACKKCTVHCYSPDYRERIRKIMAWSGKRMILHGRLDLVRHFFW